MTPKKIFLFNLLLSLLINTYGQTTYYSRSTPNTWSLTEGGGPCGCSPSATDFVEISHNWANPAFYPLTNPVNLAFGTFLTVNPIKVIVKNGGVVYQQGIVPTGMILRVESGGMWGINGGLELSTSAPNAIGSLYNDGAILVNGSFANRTTLVSGGEFCKNGSWINYAPASFNTITDANMDPFFTFTKYGGFAQCYQGVILPIKLISFEAFRTEKEINYKWVTASEINNDYFEILVSNDTFIWESISTTNGAGNSAISLNYFATSDKINYKYAKLKQVDFDGTASFSKIVYLGDNNNLSLKIIGNTVVVNSNTIQELQVHDTNGKLLYTKMVSKGLQLIELELDYQGMVILTVGTETRRFFL